MAKASLLLSTSSSACKCQLTTLRPRATNHAQRRWMDRQNQLPHPRQTGSFPGADQAYRPHHLRSVRLAAAYTGPQVPARPAHVTPAKTRTTKGICHFLGGAFAGAAPELAYSLLISMLAEAGYCVVATPFAVTFNHTACAELVHRSFNSTLQDLRRDGRGWQVPESAPIHGVGHSNGALLHLLIGALFNPPNRSNVIISFNNKQVRDAVPVPLTPLQDAVRNVRSQPWAASLPTPDALFQSAMDVVRPTGLPVDQQLLKSLLPAVDQLNSIFNEVGDGTMEFTPTPEESRALIGRGYRVPSTLLVRFEDDAIDESPQMAAVLRRQNPSGTRELLLPGTHVTPCGGDISWQVGQSFTPIDALALGAKAVSQADIRRLARKVVEHLDAGKQPDYFP